MKLFACNSDISHSSGSRPFLGSARLTSISSQSHSSFHEPIWRRVVCAEACLSFQFKHSRFHFSLEQCRVIFIFIFNIISRRIVEVGREREEGIYYSKGKNTAGRPSTSSLLHFIVANSMLIESTTFVTFACRTKTESAHID